MTVHLLLVALSHLSHNHLQCIISFKHKCIWLIANQPLQMRFTLHSTQTSHHTPSKTTSQTTGSKQGEMRLIRNLGDNQIERREKKERGEEVGK